ncbi:MAG: CvpA family protein [Desulfatiglandales bacterium]
MNVLDIIIACILVFFVVRGLIRGFIKETASLVGVVLGLLLAIRFQPLVTAMFKTSFPSMPLVELVGFGAIFFGVLVLCNLLGWGIKFLFKKALLGWVDRTLGLGLAVIKGVIITYIGIVLLTFSPLAGTPLVANSKLAPMIITSYQSMVNLISPECYNKLKKRFTEKKRKLGEIVTESAKDTAEKQ